MIRRRKLLDITHARMTRPNLARTIAMHLQFSADRRTLLWAFVLFPLAPLIGYARPELAPWLVPLSLYCSYCSGVLAHNHTHLELFRETRWNSFYSAWLSFFYGCPVFAWIPTHHASHHRYLNGAGDITRTSRYSPHNTLWNAVSYPFRCASWQLPVVRRYALRLRERGGAAYRDALLQVTALALGHAALLGLALALHGFARGALVYALTVGAPAATATLWMMFTNYVQHVDCDGASPDDHSRNFTSRWLNWFIFDNGYHSVHHERPGLHWSLARAAHLERTSRIRPDLNCDSLFSYCFEQYAWSHLRRLRHQPRPQLATDRR